MEGPARVGLRTKALVRRLVPGDVAVIAHASLDAVAAQELIASGAAAVLDADDSLSERFPNRGPSVLASAGIPLVDRLGEDFINAVRDGDIVRVEGDAVLCGTHVLARGRRVKPEDLAAIHPCGPDELTATLRAFVDNTLDHARNEMDLISEPIRPPAGLPSLAGGPCIVVIRGDGYREDFAAVARRFLGEDRVALIAVDGAADCVLQFGHAPDLIVGDMDSVSDAALRSGAALVVHGAPSGECPGAVRLDRLGVPYQAFVSRGTSEDAALLLADALGADPVVVVGMARGALDFLERNRAGMASSWLVRLRLGARLIDAHGLSRLLDRTGDGS